MIPSPKSGSVIINNEYTILNEGDLYGYKIWDVLKYIEPTQFRIQKSRCTHNSNTKFFLRNMENIHVYMILQDGYLTCTWQ